MQILQHQRPASLLNAFHFDPLSVPVVVWQSGAARRTVSDFVPRTVTADGSADVRAAVARAGNLTGALLRIRAGGLVPLSNATSVSCLAPCE